MIDKTICKFRCESVKDYGYSREVTLHAQYDETLDEDRRFANGNMVFSVTNPNVLNFFTPGKCYFLEISPAE